VPGPRGSNVRFPWLVQRLLRLQLNQHTYEDVKILRAEVKSTGYVSPIVWLKDMDKDWGRSLLADLEPLLKDRRVIGPIFYVYPFYSAKPRMVARARFALSRAANAISHRFGNDPGRDRRASGASALRNVPGDPYVQVTVYGPGSTLVDHQDGRDGWLVLFSLGCPCEFFIAGRLITVQSGDALIFNGGPQHSVLHGVRKICDKSVRAKRLSRTMKGKRIGLQIRFLHFSTYRLNR
jgi:hypothetical protein